ncbi:DUF4037 domain-containing protein [uncultured Amnibacterium sp.]|uniref:DUF4037 domain-containing protein n=1 Tax=uncultured Amnibacterium sp. TaxID=1631851 RepID=UPI0035CB8B2D
MDRTLRGRELAWRYWDGVVRPPLEERFPDLPYAAGRLGTGSDVLGFDDATSRDHDWGLRLSLFVPADAVEAVDAELARALPERFAGLPTRFAITGDGVERHRVEVATPGAFLVDRLGFDPTAGVRLQDWLSLTGQAVLEVTAGPLFTDRVGLITAARSALTWYPDDVWRHVVACDWIRLEQELPLMSRAGDAGDDRGSRVIAARLAQVAMHLAFLLHRRWPPYAKWFGTAFDSLPGAEALRAPIDVALAATTWQERQAALAVTLEALLRLQVTAGLTGPDRAVAPFWDRPYLQPAPGIVAALLDGIGDGEIRALPRGLGSIEQRTDVVDLLVDARWRRAMISA